MVVANLLAQQVPFNAIFLDLRSDAEVAAVRELHALSACRSWRAPSSSAPCSSRPSRFSRASISPTSRARACAGFSSWPPCISRRPRTSSSCRSLLALAGRRAVVCGAGRSPRHRLALGASARRACPAFRAAAHARRPQARGIRLQGRVLRPQIPRQPARLRGRLAVRLSRSLLQLLSAFCARAFRQRGAQHRENAGERLSRHVHRRRRAERHHPRSAARSDGVFPVPADDLPVSDQAIARHIRRAVRRRHLDRGGAAQQSEERYGRGGQSRGIARLPQRPGPARVHRRHPATTRSCA